MHGFLFYFLLRDTAHTLLGKLRKARRQRQRERHETKRSISNTIAVHVRYKYLYISLPSSLMGCLHDTGATFAPERVHSGSLSWLYILLHDTTTKCYAGASHPGVSSPRFSHRGENFTPVRNLATVSCKHETTTHFGLKSVCR